MLVKFESSKNLLTVHNSTTIELLQYERSQILSFSTPIGTNRICFYAHKTNGSATDVSYLYFIDPFSEGVWYALVITVFVMFILYSSIDALRMSRSLFVYLHMKEIIMTLVLAFFMATYQANLRAIFSEGLVGEPPFKSVDQLSKKISSGDGKLMLYSLVDFAYETINDCRNVKMSNPK